MSDADRVRDIVAANPPRCLRPFRVSLCEAVSRADEAAEASFAIHCGKCTADKFEVLELSIAATNSEERWPVGLNVRCASCSAEELLFDQSQHGYDGELGALEFLKGERSAKRLERRDGHVLAATCVRIGFLYSSPVDETERLAEEHGIPVQDLFDWINVWVPSKRAEWDVVWDCECA